MMCSERSVLSPFAKYAATLLALLFPLVLPLTAGADDAVEITSALKAELTPARMEPGGLHTIELTSSDEEVIDSDDGKKKERDRWNEDWLMNGEFAGELAYRWSQVETRDDGVSTTESEQSIALRLGYTMAPQDSWKLYFAAGNSRPTRPTSGWLPVDEADDLDNFDILEYWSRYDFDLGGKRELRWQAGRYHCPFDLSQLIHDNDLVMTATHMQYTDDKQRGSLSRWRLGVLAAKLRGGGSIIIETEGDDDDEGGLTLLPDDGRATLISAHLGGRWDLDEHCRLDAAVSYHDFINVNSIGAAVAAGQWRVGGPAGLGETTNHTRGNGLLVSDFNILDLWANAQWQRGTNWPVSLEAEYTRNIGAKGDGNSDDTAYFTELTVGRTGEPGDWQFELEHVAVEADAVLAAVNRGLYAANSRVSSLHARYCPMAGVEYQCSYYWKSELADAGSNPGYDEDELRVYVTFSW